MNEKKTRESFFYNNKENLKKIADYNKEVFELKRCVTQKDNEIRHMKDTIDSQKTQIKKLGGKVLNPFVYKTINSLEREKNSKKKKDKERAFSNAKCEKIYYCCPDFLGIQDNDKIIIEKTINEKYPYGNTDENFLNRVLDTMNEIQNEKYINSNCLIYLTPEKKSEIKNTIEKPKFESNQVLQSLKDKILSKSEISSKKLKLNATLHGESLGEKEIELIKENGSFFSTYFNKR